MDKRFIEQYLLNDPKLREKMWDDCFFVFDSNVLLNLYLYSMDTRKEFLAALKCVEDRIRLTSQSIIEFHKHRIAKITRQQEEFERIKGNIESSTRKINQANEQALSSFQEIRQLFRKFTLEYTFEEEEKLLEQYTQGITDKLENTKRLLPSYVSDEILNTLSELFAKRGREPFPASKIEEIEREGEVRYKSKIPPGYTDSEKEENKYGDLIIWKEMIDMSQQENKPVIFITDERKEDLWTLKDKLLLFPRLELVKEFYTETEQFFWIYNSNSFLKNVAKYCGDIEGDELDRAIQEINETQEVNRLVGEFVSNWTALEVMLRNIASNSNYPVSKQLPKDYFLRATSGKLARDLSVRGLLSKKVFEEFAPLQQFRNELVHGAITPTPQELEDAIKALNYLAEYIMDDISHNTTDESYEDNG